ncbi:MAG: hypothetical protein HC828_06310 [Blastochloris sp.]|nr:hypothetical protein [Blastochloris sp.]
MERNRVPSYVGGAQNRRATLTSIACARRVWFAERAEPTGTAIASSFLPLHQVVGPACFVAGLLSTLVFTWITLPGSGRHSAWYRMAPGVLDRQWSDVQSVLLTQGDTLDTAYLRHWATQLAIGELLKAALRRAPPPRLTPPDDRNDSPQLPLDL